MKILQIVCFLSHKFLSANRLVHRNLPLRSASSSLSMTTRQNGDHLVACPVDKYEELLSVKVQSLTSLLDFCCKLAPEVFKSPESHFRMRANFNIWKDNPKDYKNPNNFFYCMYDESKADRIPHEVTSFPRGSLLMNDLMARLMDEIKPVPCLFNSLFEVRFVTTKLGQAVIVMIYHIPLTEEWRSAATALAGKLSCKIVGRSRKRKLVIGGEDDIIEEELQVRGERSIRYFQTEGAFSQPNAVVCEKMLNWALDVSSSIDGLSHDLLELYCGGGTFTAALSESYRKILATEISKPSVELAHRCFKYNKIENVKIARMSSEEFTDAFVKNVTFRRLTEQGIRLEDYHIGTVFVDPPRAGLDEGTCQLLMRFDNIIYISCNPETLARDLRLLTETHSVRRLAAFDQFPYTKHLECGVLLVRKPGDDSTEPEEVLSKKARIE
jgi:tRNA (uracil-5-)-methyltransferase